MRLLVAAGAIGLGLVMPALAVELFVGRWAVSADVCTVRGDTPATAPIAQATNTESRSIDVALCLSLL